MSSLQANKLRSYKLLSGFTLIELLVVIAIISLLSSIVLASLSQAKAKARVVRTATDLKQIEQAIARYFLDTATVPPHLWGGGSDSADAPQQALFVSGQFWVKDPGDTGTCQFRPTSWSGPYLSQWPRTQYNDLYSWEFSPPYTITVRGMPYDEAIMLHQILPQAEFITDTPVNKVDYEIPVDLLLPISSWFLDELDRPATYPRIYLDNTCI